MLSETIKLILSLSLSGSILAIFIYMLKPLIKNKLSKTIQYIIWIIVLLRLIIPFSIEINAMNYLFSNKPEKNIQTQIAVDKIKDITHNQFTAPIITNTSKVVSNTVNNSTIVTIKELLNQYLIYIWLLGAISIFLFNVFIYIKFLKIIHLNNMPSLDSDIIALNNILTRKRNVTIKRNSYVTTPMLLGVLNPCIIIPNNNYDEEQLKNILLHETTHLVHYDVVIKWLSLIATCIHWFNPLIYLLRKEISNACELACDETVIKNLTPSERQSYGDTLISVIAEHKYPTSVLQATMCEEKKTLKERLISIMKYNKKSKVIVALSVILLAIVITASLLLGANRKDKNTENEPYNVFINSEMQHTKKALIGSYSWNDNKKYIQSHSSNATDFQYNMKNIISVSDEEQLIISTQQYKSFKKYDFTIKDIKVYKNKQLMESDTISYTLQNKDMYIKAPKESGEYIFDLTLEYEEKGTVNYGFVVRVNMLTYDLKEISKYRTPYVGNHVKVSHIAYNLPTPDSYFKQQYTSLETSNKPYGIKIYYEPASNKEYNGEWPISTPDTTLETNSRINALVVFCMVDNVDEVTFSYRITKSDGELDTSKYNTSFTFPRAGFEDKYGDLTVIGDNIELLNNILSNNNSIEETKEEKTFSQDVINFVESNIESILSSSKASSNPNDYIEQDQDGYEDIIKNSYKYVDESGNSEILNYMLSRLKQSTSNELQEYIMMSLCKELLGVQNNVRDDMPPSEWIKQLNIREEIILPDFTYDGTNLIEKLVYETEIAQSKSNKNTFTIVAPHIFGSYEEGNILKIFVTTYSSHYSLFDKTLSNEGGSIIPVAITYVKNSDGSYSLDKYERAMDGSYFSSSIQNFCTMPISQKKIKGLGEIILAHYGNYEDIIKLSRKNLIKHLKDNNQYGVSLYKEHYKKADELIPLT